jgi:hypothetical protein
MPESKFNLLTRATKKRAKYEFFVAMCGEVSLFSVYTAFFNVTKLNGEGGVSFC